MPLVSFAAQGPDAHDLLRVSGRAYKLLEMRPGKVTCREITGAIEPVSLIANFTKSLENGSKQ